MMSNVVVYNGAVGDQIVHVDNNQSSNLPVAYQKMPLKAFAAEYAYVLGASFSGAASGLSGVACTGLLLHFYTVLSGAAPFLKISSMPSAAAATVVFGALTLGCGWLTAKFSKKSNMYSDMYGYSNSKNEAISGPAARPQLADQSKPS